MTDKRGAPGASAHVWRMGKCCLRKQVGLDRNRKESSPAHGTEGIVILCIPDRHCSHRVKGNSRSVFIIPLKNDSRDAPS